MRRTFCWQREVDWYKPKAKTLGDTTTTDHDRRRMRLVSHEDAVIYYRRQLDGVNSPRERAIVLRMVLFEQRNTSRRQLLGLLRDIGFNVDGRGRPAPSQGEGDDRDQEGTTA